MDARYHFVRHAVRSGLVSLVLIPSEDNIADALTKTLRRERFEKMRGFMIYGEEKAH